MTKKLFGFGVLSAATLTLSSCNKDDVIAKDYVNSFDLTTFEVTDYTPGAIEKAYESQTGQTTEIATMSSDLSSDTYNRTDLEAKQSEEMYRLASGASDIQDSYEELIEIYNKVTPYITVYDTEIEYQGFSFLVSKLDNGFSLEIGFEQTIVGVSSDMNLNISCETSANGTIEFYAKSVNEFSVNDNTTSTIHEIRYNDSELTYIGLDEGTNTSYARKYEKGTDGINTMIEYGNLAGTTWAMVGAGNDEFASISGDASVLGSTSFSFSEIYNEYGEQVWVNYEADSNSVSHFNLKYVTGWNFLDLSSATYQTDGYYDQAIIDGITLDDYFAKVGVIESYNLTTGKLRDTLTLGRINIGGGEVFTIPTISGLDNLGFLYTEIELQSAFDLANNFYNNGATVANKDLISITSDDIKNYLTA